MIHMKIKQNRNSNLAKEIRLNRDTKIFMFDTLLEEKKILLEEKHCDVTQLREYLLSSKLTSVDLVNYYGARTLEIGRKNCYTTEELFDRAMTQAKKCDKEREAAI
jgi:hypothetical protein